MSFKVTSNSKNDQCVHSIFKYAKDRAMLNEMSDPTKIRKPSSKDDSSLFAIMGWLLFSLLSAGSSSWQFFEAVTISRAHLSRLVDKGAVLLVSMTICLFGNHHLKPFSAYSVCFFLIQLCTFFKSRASEPNECFVVDSDKESSCAQLTCWASLISAWLVGWLFHIVLFSSSLLSYIKKYIKLRTSNYWRLILLMLMDVQRTRKWLFCEQQKSMSLEGGANYHK